MDDIQPIYSSLGMRSSLSYTSKRRAHPTPSAIASTSTLAAYPTTLQLSAVKGLWLCSTHCVLTVDFPLVTEAVAYAESHWASPPTLEDTAVYALAALSVASHPSTAAHWVFWGDKSRDLSMKRCRQALSESRGAYPSASSHPHHPLQPPNRASSISTGPCLTTARSTAITAMAGTSSSTPNRGTIG